MSIYGDRSKEEINGLLQTYKDAFNVRFGHPINKEHLKQWLTDRREELIKESYSQSFGTLNPKSIDLVLNSIDSNPELLKSELESTDNDSQLEVCDKSHNDSIPVPKWHQNEFKVNDSVSKKQHNKHRKHN